MGIYKQGLRAQDLRTWKPRSEDNPDTPLTKHCLNTSWDCSSYTLSFAMTFNNSVNKRMTTTLNRKCLTRVLRNPTPKMTTMCPVGIGVSQVEVGAQHASFCEKHIVSVMTSLVFSWQDIKSSDTWWFHLSKRLGHLFLYVRKTMCLWISDLLASHFQYGFLHGLEFIQFLKVDFIQALSQIHFRATIRFLGLGEDRPGFGLFFAHSSDLFWMFFLGWCSHSSEELLREAPTSWDLLSGAASTPTLFRTSPNSSGLCEILPRTPFISLNTV